MEGTRRGGRRRSGVEGRSAKKRRGMGGSGLRGRRVADVGAGAAPKVSGLRGVAGQRRSVGVRPASRGCSWRMDQHTVDEKAMVKVRSAS